MQPRNSRKSDNWTSLLSTALAKKGKLPEGPNWKTFTELMAENPKQTENALRAAVSKLVKDGKLQTFSGHIVENGVTRRRIWYSPVQ